MAAQKEVTYDMSELGPEGSVISKGHTIRYFQEQNPRLIVTSTGEFKLNWETRTVNCRFGVKDKFADDTVSKEKFEEIMQTNSNLLRDLEEANKKIAEYKELNVFEGCLTEQQDTCYREALKSGRAISLDGPDCEPDEFAKTEDSGRGDRAKEIVVEQTEDIPEGTIQAQGDATDGE